MATNNKKQRQKLKRKARKQEARRRESISPVKRLADAKTPCECWISDDFDGNGKAQIFVYKNGGGLSGVAAFLVDRGVVGLKDAFTRMRVDRFELDDMLEGAATRGVPMRRCSLEDARRWIAGGARWAHDNGMRLPKDWLKTASILGGVGDWMSADVSKFEMEFAGHPEDLRQRLIGQPFDEYIQRTDIEFVFSEHASYMDQETGDYVSGWEDGDEDFGDEEYDDGDDEPLLDLTFEEMDTIADRFTPAATALASGTATWLAARGETASPQLTKAWCSLLAARLLSKEMDPDAPEEENEELAYDLLQELSGRIEQRDSVEHDIAIGQALDHLLTDSMMMQKAVLEHGVATTEASDQKTD